MKRTMESFLAEMRQEGKEFGSRIRKEQRKSAMPERPVREGSTSISEEEKTAGVQAFWVETMARLKLPSDMDFTRFLGRKQEEINPWVR